MSLSLITSTSCCAAGSMLMRFDIFGFEPCACASITRWKRAASGDVANSRPIATEGGAARVRDAANHLDGRGVVLAAERREPARQARLGAVQRFYDADRDRRADGAAPTRAERRQRDTADQQVKATERRDRDQQARKRTDEIAHNGHDGSVSNPGSPKLVNDVAEVPRIKGNATAGRPGPVMRYGP